MHNQNNRQGNFQGTVWFDYYKSNSSKRTGFNLDGAAGVYDLFIVKLSVIDARFLWVVQIAGADSKTFDNTIVDTHGYIYIFVFVLLCLGNRKHHIHC